GLIRVCDLCSKLKPDVTLFGIGVYYSHPPKGADDSMTLHRLSKSLDPLSTSKTDMNVDNSMLAMESTRNGVNAIETTSSMVANLLGAGDISYTNAGKDSVRKLYQQHILYVVQHLCIFHSVDLKWTETIANFATKVNTLVKQVDPLNMEISDIRHYVKVKRLSGKGLPLYVYVCFESAIINQYINIYIYIYIYLCIDCQGGSIEDCQVINGLAFRKNVAHRKMRTSISQPKILLLDCPIEYHRMSSKLTSFDILLKQEPEYMKMLVDKIKDLGPDIVVVSNSVARLAQNYMAKTNITLICNLSASLMQRLARCIGAPVITSVDHINHLNPKLVLGDVCRFLVKYFLEDPHGRRTPLVFFNGCSSDAHATIVLRGGTKLQPHINTYNIIYVASCYHIKKKKKKREKLKDVKQVMRLATHTVYSSELEISLLNDQLCTMTANGFELYEKVQQENDKMLFLSTTPYQSHVGWRRDVAAARSNKFKLSLFVQRHPHLQKYPFDHNGLGSDLNMVGHWDPFLPNTDNLSICQTLVVNHCRVAKAQQCFPPRIKRIDFYTDLDLSLGAFLHQLFRCEDCPNERCREHLTDHTLTYSHHDGRVVVNVRKDDRDMNGSRILMWSRCKHCSKMVTPTVPMTSRTYDISFGRYLEMTFYRHPIVPRVGSCNHNVHEHHVRCFAFANMIVEIGYENIAPLTTFTCRHFRVNWKNQFDYYLTELNLMEIIAKGTFVAFKTKRLIMNLKFAFFFIFFFVLCQPLTQQKCCFFFKKKKKKMMNQFTSHRQMFKVCYDVKVHNLTVSNVKEESLLTISLDGPTPGELAAATCGYQPNTVEFLNEMRKVLFVLSKDWNETLDALKKLLVPTSEPESTYTSQFLKRFIAGSSERKKLDPEAITKSASLLEAEEALEKLANSEINLHLDATSNGAGTDTTQVAECQSVGENGNALKTQEDIQITSSNGGGNVNGGNNDSANGEIGNQWLQLQVQAQPQISNASSGTGVISPPESPAPSVGMLPLATGGQKSKSTLRLNIEKADLPEELEFMVNFENLFADPRVVAEMIKIEDSKILSMNSIPGALRSTANSRRSSLNNMKRYGFDEKENGMMDITATTTKSGGALPGDSDQSIIQTQPSLSYSSSSEKEENMDMTPQPPDMLTLKYEEETNKEPLSDVSKREREEKTAEMQNQEWEKNFAKNIPDMRRLPKECAFLNDPDRGNFGLQTCFDGKTLPVYRNEPSSLIAYTLSSLEYHCRLMNIKSEEIRSCLERNVPAFQELHNKVCQLRKARRYAAEKELEVRQKPKDVSEKVAVGDIGSLSAFSDKGEGAKKANKKFKEWGADDELDLEDLLYHLQKVPNTSKLDYLTNRKGYVQRLKDSRYSLTSPVSLDPLVSFEEFGNRQSLSAVQPSLLPSLVSFSQLRTDAMHGSMPSPVPDATSQSNQTNSTNNTKEVMKFKFQSVYQTSVGESDSKIVTTFSCAVYYPRQFRALRARFYEEDQTERNFIESLARCQAWDASGGKSGMHALFRSCIYLFLFECDDRKKKRKERRGEGVLELGKRSPFAKTLDERYVLKFLSPREFKMFIDNAERYFEHMASVLFLSYPSLLVNILGVYQISWTKSTFKKDKKTKSNKLNTQYVIVMPNLWYSKTISCTFDLKGSTRGRYVDETASVMLDENFIETFQGFPIPLNGASKRYLHKAIHNDTLFLSKSQVVDYSLLVGIDKSRNELVLGIIDYLQQYTWDKVAEEAVKSVGMAVGKAAPTIISPSNYRQRFREAMEKYFMISPDRKTKLLAKPSQKSLKDATRDIHILCDLMKNAEHIF
ncbi:hypothetical protein RFI_37343, partial [Reticulomyxa filosa]